MWPFKKQEKQEKQQVNVGKIKVQITKLDDTICKLEITGYVVDDWYISAISVYEDWLDNYASFIAFGNTAIPVCNIKEINIVSEEDYFVDAE